MKLSKQAANYRINKNIWQLGSIFFAVTIFLSALGFQSLKTNAQSAPSAPSGVTVSPFKQDLTLMPGQTEQNFVVTVTNNTKDTKELSFMVMDFGTLDDTGGIFFSGNRLSQIAAKYGLADWITLNQKTAVLEPGTRADVKGTVINRDSLTPGGHYAAIMVNANAPQGAQNQNNVNVRQTVTSLLFARKLGGEKYDLKLDSFTQNGSKWQAPSKATLRFYNPGNVYNIPRGTVSLYAGNKLIKQGVINEESGFVMPETYRKFPVQLKQIAPEPPMPINKYTLRIEYRYDGVDKTASKTVPLVVINIRLVFGLIILLIGILVLIALLLRKKGVGVKARKFMQNLPGVKQYLAWKHRPVTPEIAIPEELIPSNPHGTDSSITEPKTNDIPTEQKQPLVNMVEASKTETDDSLKIPSQSDEEPIAPVVNTTPRTIKISITDASETDKNEALKRLKKSPKLTKKINPQTKVKKTTKKPGKKSQKQ